MWRCVQDNIDTLKMPFYHHKRPGHLMYKSPLTYEYVTRADHKSLVDENLDSYMVEG